MSRRGIITSSPNDPLGSSMTIRHSPEVLTKSLKFKDFSVTEFGYRLVIQKCVDGKTILSKTITVENKAGIYKMAMKIKELNPGKYLMVVDDVDEDIYYLQDIKPLEKPVYKSVN